MMSLIPRVCLIGVHGHGANHLANVRRLQDEGRCRLVAVADPVPPSADAVGPQVAVYADLTALLAATAVDVVVLCTPIHTHTDLAREALRAGADVLLEKPPVPTMADFRHLQEVSAQTGRSCQIGFQGLGSAAVAALRSAIAAGALGEVTTITAECSWVRPASYFRRSCWTGRRELDGIAVMDGALTNPFAHAIVTALHVDGSDMVHDVRSVDSDLFHANDIHSDDTSVARIRTRRGTTVVVAATLCSPQDEEPTVTVRGTRATAFLSYGTDTIRVEPVLGANDAPQELAGSYDRVNLLANLIEHRQDPSVELVAELSRTGSFTAVLESLRRAPDPAPIPADCVTWLGSGDERHAVVRDVRRWIRLAVERRRTFTELGAPWTDRRRVGQTHRLHLRDREIADYDPGLDISDIHAPRPYLHPVRTLGGLTVTDAGPRDHPWHLGLGIAVQDVNGANLWGGPTYVRDNGYRWRPDHGRIEPVDRRERAAGVVEQDLRWVDARGAALLTERRRLAWSPVPGSDGVWQLTLATTLMPATDADVRLGSPATHGRTGAGYGGLFWRLPPVDGIEVSTPDATGEDAVHGSIAPWLAVSLRVHERAATVLLIADPQTPDPWFVRVADYPGIGAAWAWDSPRMITAATPLHRSYRILVADGAVDPRELVADIGTAHAIDVPADPSTPSRITAGRTVRRR